MNKLTVQFNEIERLTNLYKRLGIDELIDHDKLYLYSIIAHSTQIEGSTLSEIDTQLLLDEGLTSKGKPIVFHLMNQDLKAAYDYAIKSAKEKQPVTPDFLKKLSSLLMKNTGETYNSMMGSWSVADGDFRLHGVTAGAGGRSYVNFQKIPALVDSLCDEINKRMPDVKTLPEKYSLSFNAHLNFVTIHPFGDGNGRAARLLMNYIQFYYNLIPTKLFSEDKAEYIEVLKEAQVNDNLTPYRLFMNSQHIKMLDQQIIQFQKSQNKDINLSF